MLHENICCMQLNCMQQSCTVYATLLHATVAYNKVASCMVGLRHLENERMGYFTCSYNYVLRNRLCLRGICKVIHQTAESNCKLVLNINVRNTV